jgi:uncharacterized damage-inducible protein DinB
MDRVATLVAEWERAKAGTKEYLEAAGADQLSFRPASESRSFAEQFLHVASTQYSFAEHHAHHRGQTGVYLRLSGITPPSEHLF